MRRGECTLGAQHTVIEFLWLWFDVWSNDCPGIIQGSSGSPLFELDDDGGPAQIVGMINTTTAGAIPENRGDCTINHPCEVTDDGDVEMMTETSYAQSVAGIGSCFDAVTGEFALTGACPLPVSDVWDQVGGGAFRGGELPDAAGRVPRVSLSGNVAGTVRTALVPLGDATVCTDPANYAEAETHGLVVAEHLWEDATEVAVALPEEEGWFALCAVREDAYDQAATVLFQVDRTLPALAAAADVEQGYDGVLVRPHINPPEIAQVRFTWVPGEEQCPDRSTFEDFFVVPLHLAESDLPATYCIYGVDQAGNTGEVTRIPIPG